VEFATKIVPLRNGDKIKAQIWDTGFLIINKKIIYKKYNKLDKRDIVQ